tara:strand:+ start:13033 stop:13935 length:903 start_codon:yes stop_codon:yes gene_type:complete
MIHSNKIIRFLNLKVINDENFEIKHICPPDDLKENCITLLTRSEEFESLFSSCPKNILSVIPEGLNDIAKTYNSTFLISNNPRLTFSKIIDQFFKKKVDFYIHDNAYINTDLIIHEKASIASHAMIDGSISIGSKSIIGNSVKIFGKVKIGNNVKIGPGTSIGHDGFNYSRDQNGVPHEFPHIGKVIIGNNVTIGANCTIAKGSLNNTIIEDNVKIDDQVHIAHNVKIESNTLIAAKAEISGSVEIGKNVWISPNASIINHIKIGSGSKIGIGAVVLKNIPQNSTVIGNPGRVLPTGKSL